MKGDTAGQGVVPLRTILRNILNLIDSFEQRYKEGLDSYDQEFQELKQFSENLKSDPGYLCKEGEKSVNRKKNRYKDILPFDYTRVILGDYGDIPGSDYINANFIKGASGSSAYIACQGPLPHTVNDFWRMVVECEVQVIVMACNEQESGKHKCENYWVEEEGVEREFGQVTVWLKKSRQVCPDFLVRTMKIRYPNSKGEPEERSVCQFHYSAWPDHGVPLKVRPLLDMVRLIRDCQTSETLPVLVHCSAGCGRTGTICAIDYVWGLLRLGKLSPEFSLFNLVRDMRRQRIAMVQTKDQYILVHRAVRELFEEQLKIIDSHPYANVDINGLPLEIRADLEEPVYEMVQFVSTVPTDDGEERSKKSVVMKPITCPDVPAKNNERVLESNQKQINNLEQPQRETLKKVNESQGSLSKASCTPSPSSVESRGDASGSEGTSKELLDLEKDASPEEKSKRGSVSKQGSSQKSSLLRNPSIIKLKAFFEKSKDDKEKKSIPTLSRAKSDVSSSSRFYANLASTFTSRGTRYSPSRTKTSSTSSSPKEEDRREKAPAEKIKSKPALLQKPNISVKRSKSLRIMRPSEEQQQEREHVSLISTNSIGTDIPDSSKLVRASISSSTSSASSQVEANAIKVSVRQVDMPKLQQPVSKSVKTEAHKATTSRISPGEGPPEGPPSKKPDVPSKSHLLEKVIPVTSGIYGTTRNRIGLSKEDSYVNQKVKVNGKLRQKFGTVNPKILSPSGGGGGTALTRSQSHVWQPSKSQVPVRIFSDENLSQLGAQDVSMNRGRGNDDHSRSFDEPDGTKLIRKQSLPITKLFSAPSTSTSKVKQTQVIDYSSDTPTSKDQPRSLTLTSHSSFIEARKRVPKTNPYANYTPGSGDSSSSFSEKSGRLTQEKGGSPLTQFHFGDTVPLLKNNGNVGNSSESSSNPGTPRNSLPGTPTQSVDVLYSPISLNYPHARGQSSKSILKGSLSSTPSESDERLDILRGHNNVSTTAQSQVPSNITGPQKISSVRAAVGIRERRNSFRQAVWKEDLGPTPNLPVENDKSENIYITTATSVPYSVKTSAPLSLHTNTANNMSTAPSSGATKTYATVPVTAAGASQQAPRLHRDYEPVWPEPTDSGNYFKIGGPPNTTRLRLNAESHTDRPQQASSSTSFPGEERPQMSKLPQSKLESQVQDRMAEIKVLLAELRSPGKCEDSTQRSLNGTAETSQLSGLKATEKLSQNSFSSAEKPQQHSSTSSTPTTTTTNLKHHRSLRAPSRPHYEQNFSCFTFRKPSSFESITDQLFSEEKDLSSQPLPPPSTSSSQHVSDEGNRIKLEMNIRGDPFHPAQSSDRMGANNGHPRLNDYVPLRVCRSASVGRSKMEPEHQQQQHVMNGSSSGQHVLLGKSDSTPIPPPRSKRMGVRRDQGDYANVTPAPKQNWGGSQSNGVHSDNHHRFHNGTTTSTSKLLRKDSMSDMEQDNHHPHHRLPNGQEFSRLTSTGSIPLTNGNTGQTSPKAIIRALGLFQAKAANVRSRLASWAENKDRSSAKRSSSNHSSSALTRLDRSSGRGGFGEVHSSRPVAAPPSVSAASGPNTSKHQYL